MAHQRKDTEGVQQRSEAGQKLSYKTDTQSIPCGSLRRKQTRQC